jgi:hypothetical protein
MWISSKENGKPLKEVASHLPFYKIAPVFSILSMVFLKVLDFKLNLSLLFSVVFCLALQLLI